MANNKDYKEDNLFDNNMVRNAMKSMSPDDLLRYKEFGEAMYADIDFEAAKVLKNLPPPMEEALAYVEEGLKSGLHPSMLDEDELALLTEAYGDKWYNKWGYTKKDLTEIVTVIKNN